MAENVLYAVVAFLTGLVALFAGVTQTPPPWANDGRSGPWSSGRFESFKAPDQSQREVAIRKLVEELIERARALRVEKSIPNAPPSPSRLPDQPATEGCSTEHVSEGGRTSTTVVCSKRSLGSSGASGKSIAVSRIIVSSSTSDDEP
jgi:hypothetical protein